MEKEFKNFTVDLQKGFKAIDKGEGSAVIATLNVIDHDGDVITAGAFNEQHVDILPAHDRMAPRMGKGILTEADNMAVASFKFNLDVDAKTAREWHSALKFDMENGEPLQEWSFGFKIVDADFGEFQGKQVRFLRKLDVHEISPVMKGAGINTGTLALKNEKITFDEQIKNAKTALNAVSGLIERTKSLNDLKVQKGQKGINDERKHAVNEIGKSLSDLMVEFEILEKHLSTGRDEIDITQIKAQYQKNLYDNNRLMEVIK